MAKVFKNGKWIGEDIKQAEQIAAVPAKPIYPRDIEPTAPTPPASDHDRPRWVAENVKYLEKLGEYRSLQQFRSEHPELVSRMLERG